MSRTPTVAPAPSPDRVLAVCPLAALQDDGARQVQDGVVVVRQGDRLYAFEERCPHAGASLAEAELRHGAVRCPEHGARFRLEDGRRLAGPSRRPLRCYAVEPAGADLLVLAHPPASPARPSWVRRLLRHVLP